eukprot:6365474-Prymnesium_polylepis.3
MSRARARGASWRTGRREGCGLPLTDSDRLEGLPEPHVVGEHAATAERPAAAHACIPDEAD